MSNKIVENILGIFAMLLIILMSMGVLGFVFWLPYIMGWDILLNNNYFESPDSFILEIQNFKGWNGVGFWIGICGYFNLILFISFVRRSKFSQYGADFDKPLNYLFINHNKIRPLYLLYLIYITPTIFINLYPVILNFFEEKTGKTLYIPFIFNILSCIFFISFIFTVYKIIKNNRSVKLLDLKEEIKMEILSEEKK
jgi:hypothetical protein